MYPWFAVFDCESILEHIPTDENTEKTKWIRRHSAVSASVCSNIPGKTDSRCFVNSDQKELVGEMLKYLVKISDTADSLARQRWGYVFGELDELIESYKKVNF